MKYIGFEEEKPKKKGVRTLPSLYAANGAGTFGKVPRLGARSPTDGRFGKGTIQPQRPQEAPVRKIGSLPQASKPVTNRQTPSPPERRLASQPAARIKQVLPKEPMRIKAPDSTKWPNEGADRKALGLQVPTAPNREDGAPRLKGPNGQMALPPQGVRGKYLQGPKFPEKTEKTMLRPVPPAKTASPQPQSPKLWQAPSGYEVRTPPVLSGRNGGVTQAKKPANTGQGNLTFENYAMDQQTRQKQFEQEYRNQTQQQNPGGIESFGQYLERRESDYQQQIQDYMTRQRRAKYQKHTIDDYLAIKGQMKEEEILSGQSC